MSLTVSRLRFHDFRNYPSFDLDGIGKTTVFVGSNAVGKTNIIEGIQLLTALESFRNPTTEMLMRWGCDQGFIQAQMKDGARELDVRLVLDGKGRRYQLNGKTRPRNDLQGQLPAVLFSPDDLQLVKGGPDLRRNALDALGMQVSKNYRSVKTDYEKLLRQKNRLLKEEVLPGYLASVDEVLARIGSQLLVYRLKMASGISRFFSAQHAAITGSNDKVSFAYHSNIPEVETMEVVSRDSIEGLFHNQLERRRAEEMARKTSLVGPHRDKPVFLLNDHDAGDFASQGQQRSLVIAYKLAELSFLEETTHQKPLLLLDDVMSELDSARREMLTDYVSRSAQTFITTTNIDYFTASFLEQSEVIELPLKG